MTIRELFQEFVIAKRKARAEFNAAITQTWYGAVLPLQKKIKPLKAYLLEGHVGNPNSPEAMKAMLYRTAQVHGLRVRHMPELRVHGQ